MVVSIESSSANVNTGILLCFYGLESSAADQWAQIGIKQQSPQTIHLIAASPHFFWHHCRQQFLDSLDESIPYRKSLSSYVMSDLPRCCDVGGVMSHHIKATRIMSPIVNVSRLSQFLTTTIANIYWPNRVMIREVTIKHDSIATAIIIRLDFAHTKNFQLHHFLPH